jgi:hypothetical protein
MKERKRDIMKLISTKITLPKGYFVADSEVGFASNIDGIVKLAAKLEKANIVLTANAIKRLTTLTGDSFETIKKDILATTKAVKGEFLRPVFASTSDVALEEMTLEDYCIQMWMYFNTYALGRYPDELFVLDENRKVELANAAKRKDVKDLNNTFKFLDVKNVADFVNEVRAVLSMPIVFGAQQEEFIKEAFDKGLLGDAIEGVNFKVKENIFVVLGITGKDFFKDINILNTATDILRYAYYVSGQDFKELPRGARFNLKTADKMVIMSNLDKVASNNIANAFGDIKPKKSQWLALSRNLFPGSKKFSKFMHAQGVFNVLRNGGNIETYNTITQRLIAVGDMLELTKHLASRPGELLRSLDMIIRKAEKEQIDGIVDIISNLKLNPKLIIQVKKWLEYRTGHAFEERVFNVKGKPVTVDNKPLKELKTKRTMKVVEALNEVIMAHLKGKDLFPEPIELEDNSNEVA